MLKIPPSRVINLRLQSGGGEEMKEPLARVIDADSDSDDFEMSFKSSYRHKNEDVHVTSLSILKYIALIIWPSTCFFRREKIYMTR